MMTLLLLALTQSPVPDLFDAIRKGRLAVVKKLVEAQPDLVKSVDYIGDHPLHHVPTLEMAEYLLSKGADPEARTKEGLRPLGIALQAKQEDIALLLIRSKARFDDYPLLHLAATMGSTKLLGIGLDAKMPVDSKDPYDATPLHRAVGGGHSAAAILLLEEGADVNVRTKARAQFIGGINRSYNGLQTPLHSACLRGDLAMATRLIQKGAKVDARSQIGATPLHHAARSGNVELIQLLLKSGAKVNDAPPDPPLLYTEGNGYAYGSPLHVAAEAGHLDAVRALLENQAAVNDRDFLGRTPLHGLLDDLDYGQVLSLWEIRYDGHFPKRSTEKAKKGDREGILKLLVERGADVSAKDQQGLTPLKIARESKNDRAVELLVKSGAKE